MSRRILALEDRLGVSLFERRTSGMRPTAAGAEFLAESAEALDRLDAAVRRVRAAAISASGRLVIATYFSASRGILRERLARYAHEHPGVGLRVMEGTRCELLTAIRTGRADVALLLGPAGEAGLDQLDAWSETVMVALHEHHRLAGRVQLTWQELATETFIIVGRGAGREAEARIRGFLPVGHAACFIDQDVGREGAFNLVGTGLGIAVLADSASGACYPGVVFLPVGDGRGSTTVQVTAYWDPKRDNPALRRFLALLRSEHGRATSSARPA